MLKFFNSYSSKIEPFLPLDSNRVKMYVCGITPYDTTHLGHAFVYLTFDVLKRFLEFKGYKVTYTQNVTDIDDDILKRAKKVGRDWMELGDFWTIKFLADLKTLNIQMPDNFIKATEAMDEIIKMVGVLIQKGVAYEKNGNVYFQINRFAEYGKLSKFPFSQMMQLLKERGENPDDPNKKSPLDFILWQKSLPDEPFWESPFSKGRPGWHIECSAMIKKTLGEQIDIHGGGYDLIFPHHESELAQSESASGKSPSVKYWIHTAMVSYMGKKISKSVGNLVLISDLLRKYSVSAIRLMLLLNHYRKSWEYTDNLTAHAQKIMDGLEAKFKKIHPDPDNLNDLLYDLEEDFNAEAALKKIMSKSSDNAPQAKAALQLLGFKFD